MAIRIPSKNIYEKKNAKVIDNTIDRIEVNSLEITKKNVYGTTAYEEAKEYLIEQQTDIREWEDDDFWWKDKEIGLGYAFLACNVISKEYYNLIPELIVPRQNGNNAIKKIRSLSYSIAGIKKTYSCTGEFTAPPSGGSGGDYFHESFEIEQQIEEEGINGSIYESVIENSATGTLKDTKDLSATAKVNPMDWSDVPQTYEVHENYYIFKNIKVLVKKEVLKLQAESDEAGLKGQATTHEASGTYIEYIPDNIVLNVNGDIVTIDIKDKVVYIPDGDKTSKKVISFEGNELMQTTNHTEGNANDFISTQFALTKENYAKGKETATILCSINDYYDFETGELKISAKGEILKMCFYEYDQVIPMVYGADGKDYPMSLNADGTPKVFTVLGTKIFYDGAVWQELYLQET